jgi:hypothetical protein
MLYIIIRAMRERSSNTVAQYAEVPAAAFDTAVPAEARAHGGLEEAKALLWVIRVRLARGSVFACGLALATELVLFHRFAEAKVERHACICSNSNRFKKGGV